MTRVVVCLTVLGSDSLLDRQSLDGERVVSRTTPGKGGGRVGSSSSRVVLLPPPLLLLLLPLLPLLPLLLVLRL